MNDVPKHVLNYICGFLDEYSDVLSLRSIDVRRCRELVDELLRRKLIRVEHVNKKFPPNGQCDPRDYLRRTYMELGAQKSFVAVENDVVYTSRLVGNETTEFVVYSPTERKHAMHHFRCIGFGLSGGNLCACDEMGFVYLLSKTDATIKKRSRPNAIASQFTSAAFSDSRVLMRLSNIYLLLLAELRDGEVYA